MKTYGIFLYVDKYANDGYAFKIEEAYEDGSYWCWNDLNRATSDYKLVQEIQLGVEDHALWLVQQGLEMCEQAKVDAQEAFTRNMASIAELESKFTLITHQPSE